MNHALLSIMALVGAIGIGVWRGANTGIISMFFAFTLGEFVFGLKGKDIVTYWPLDIFFVMMSAMLMFAFANVKETLINSPAV